MYEIKRLDDVEGLKLSKPHGYELNSQLRFLVQKSIYDFRIRPFMAWSYFQQQIGNYMERREGNRRLVVGEDCFYSLEMALGTSIWMPFWCGRNHDWNLVPNLGFSFVQALAKNNHPVDTCFMGTPMSETTVEIQKVSQRYWVLEAGLSSYFQDCSEFFFTYKGIFDSRYATNQEYRFGAQMAF